MSRFIVLAWFVFIVELHAQQPQAVSFTNQSGLVLNALLYQPGTPARTPAVVIIHGSGGMWRNDDPVAGVMNPNFREWATNLTAAGFAALFVDSYTPRGFKEFRSKRPAEDPAIDDAACSPAYERPKDAHAALRYLRSLPQIRGDRIGLVAFSQGAESALSAVLDRNLNRTWSSSYLLTNGVSTNKTMPAPPRLSAGEQGFAVALCYYPGCGFFGYYGSPSATSAGMYMPETPTLIFHGSADPLYANDLYPDRLRSKSRAEATMRQLSYNPLALFVFNGAEHSFDEETLPSNPANDTASQQAKRESRIIAMDWLRTYLGDITIVKTTSALEWNANVNTRYELGQSADLNNWSYAFTSNSGSAPIQNNGERARFFQMRARGVQLELLQ